MKARENVKRHVVERFALAREPKDPRAAEAEALEAGPLAAPQHFRRFMRLAAARKQQMLERLLLQEEE